MTFTSGNPDGQWPTINPEFELWPESWPYWTRMYEETAKRLYEAGDFHAADDLGTLVMGLVQYEREEATSGDGLTWYVGTIPARPATVPRHKRLRNIWRRLMGRNLLA